jgi:hypothetical protein
LPQELVKAINQYPEFVLINFPAYLQLINIELELANITRFIYAYLEFYLLYNVIPFRVLNYYKLASFELLSQPIKINDEFIKNNINQFRNKASILDSLTSTEKCFIDIITNCDTIINSTAYCKNYILEKNYYSYIYACSLYPANSIELSNTFICSYTRIYNTASNTKYSYELDNNNACSSNTVINNNCSLLVSNNYVCDTNIQFNLINGDECKDLVNENRCYTVDLVCNNDYSILDYMKIINVCGDRYICSNKNVTNEYELMFN